jgi:DNA polymerase III subunit alpha
VPDCDERQRLAQEKEVLGYYLSSHPLAEYQATLDTYCTHTTAAAAGLPHRTEVMLGGMLAAIKFSHSKNPKPGAPSKYAMFDLEDMSGIMRSIVWPSDFVNIGQYVEADRVLAVRGTIDKRPGSEEANLIVNELIPLEELAARYTKGVIVRVDERVHGEQALESLREIVRGYPGRCELQIVLALADGSKVVCRCEQVRVELNDQMRRRVEELLGAENFRTFAAPPSSKPPSSKPTNGRTNGAARAPALARG